MVYLYTFLCFVIYCVVGLSFSGLGKIRFNAYTLRRISTKNHFSNKPGFPLSKLIIFVWYPYVSLFPDLWCNIALSVTGLRKIRFNGYTLRRVSTKNQFPNKPGFPLSKLIIFVWYPYVSLFPDLLCYGLECQRFTQNTFQRLYTPPDFHKKSVLKQTRSAVVQVNNFSVVSLRFSVP